MKIEIDFKSCHLRHLPSYVRRRTGHEVLGGCHLATRLFLSDILSYSFFWIRQSVQRYFEKCGFMVRIPSHPRQKIARYKKIVQELEQKLGRVPTESEIADKMRVSVGLLPKLKI